MRLICPNCDAEYEVPASAIPDEGRDVQCSNCGHTWFFNPAELEEPEPVVDDEPLAEPEGAVEPEPEPEAKPEPEVEPDPEPVAEPEREVAAAAPVPRRPVPRPKRTPTPTFTPPAEAPPAYPSDEEDGRTAARVAEAQRPVATGPKRRELQPEVAEVLRQEAEFEASARARDAGLEVQGDLGLDPPPAAPSAPPTVPPPTLDKAGERAARRDLLPDIDEINSTLRAAGDRDDAPQISVDQEELQQTRRKGFRVGFGLSLLLLGALAAIYAYAPQLGDALPGLEAALGSYTGAVDILRTWLAEQVARGAAAAQAISEG